MTLRVFFRTTDGSTDFIEYGCDATNKEGILKVELLEDSSKRKSWMGSKFVGLSKFDEKEVLQELVVEKKSSKVKSKKKTINTPEYEIFNYKVHDTDREYYWVSALCSNCNESAQVAIPRKQKINKTGFKCLFCPKCGVEKSLHYARWNAKKYVMVGK